MNWHFNFKQCRLFNSRSISTIESPLRSWRFPFSQLFFSLFLGGQSALQQALQDSKKVRFGREPEEAGPMKWSKRFQKSCKTTIFCCNFFSNFRALWWKAENSVHVVFELWFCSTAQIQNYMKKQSDIVEKMQKLIPFGNLLFLSENGCIFCSVFLFFFKEYFLSTYSFLKKSIIVKFSKS